MILNFVDFALKLLNKHLKSSPILKLLFVCNRNAFRIIFFYWTKNTIDLQTLIPR